jgi:DNA-binding helix-hairpin-helix protein with protein kinase domain
MEYFSAGHRLILGKQLGQGGEGEVFLVENNPLICFKRFFDNKRLQKQKKVEALLQISPPVGSCFTVCWPLASVVNENREWVGYVMPLVKNCTNLYELTLNQMNSGVNCKVKQKFAHTQTQTLLKVAANLTIAVAKVHETHAVFGDFKPQNTLVSESGHIYLLDIDSIQIGLFPNDVRSMEYKPQEHTTCLTGLLDPSWDRFSLAVIIYELLCRINPFAASFKDPYEDVTMIQTAIDRGLLVNHPATQPFIYAAHPFHHRFHDLHPKVKSLLIRGCSENPLERPSAMEWAHSLGEIILQEEKKKITIRSHHQINH